MLRMVFLLLISSSSLVQAFIKEEWISPERDQFDCHGSSIVEVDKDTLLVVWKGGIGRGKCNVDMKDDVGIWQTRFQEGKWSSPQRISTDEERNCWNPVLCKLPSQELLLFYRVGPDPRRFLGVLKRSLDGGKSWSPPTILPAGILGPIKNKPVLGSRGKLICGSSIEVGEPEDPLKTTSCWIEVSEDAGRSWKKFGPIQIPGKEFGAISPALFFDDLGILHLFCRDRSLKIGGEGFIWHATSEDEGETWTPLRKTSLPNPDTSFDAIYLGEGKALLVYNHSFNHRYPLNIAFSTNHGETWTKCDELESNSGEFPAVIQTQDGLVHITYASSPLGSEQRRIKHVVIDPNMHDKIP